MEDHAAPCRYESESDDLCTEKGTCDSDEPHSYDIINKWLFRFADTLHQTFYDDREAIERFRKRNHAKNRCSKVNDFLIGRKKLHKVWRKKKQTGA